MNIESKLWKVVSYGSQIAVLQKASGYQRFVTHGNFPNSDELAAMNKQRFNKVCREAFHSWGNSYFAKGSSK